MVYIDKNQTTFDITLTLGDGDTNNPPPLALGFDRQGTNETVLHVVNSGDITTGDEFITIADVPTNVVSGNGQFEFYVYDYTDPLNPDEIERGLCIVITDNPINKTSYGTDRTRSEYQGHI